MCICLNCGFWCSSAFFNALAVAWWPTWPPHCPVCNAQNWIFLKKCRIKKPKLLAVGVTRGKKVAVLEAERRQRGPFEARWQPDVNEQKRLLEQLLALQEKSRASPTTYENAQRLAQLDYLLLAPPRDLGADRAAVQLALLATDPVTVYTANGISDSAHGWKTLVRIVQLGSKVTDANVGEVLDLLESVLQADVAGHKDVGADQLKLDALLCELLLCSTAILLKEAGKRLAVYGMGRLVDRLIQLRFEWWRMAWPDASTTNPHGDALAGVRTTARGHGGRMSLITLLGCNVREVIVTGLDDVETSFGLACDVHPAGMMTAATDAHLDASAILYSDLMNENYKMPAFKMSLAALKAAVEAAGGARAIVQARNDDSLTEAGEKRERTVNAAERKEMLRAATAAYLEVSGRFLPTVVGYVYPIAEE